ncbi:MAG: hypothetical protein WD073_01775 [Xanthobacteraceae bacterium]
MRVFLISCLAIVVLAIAALYVLGSVQEPSGVAFSSTATRVETRWSWREPVSETAAAPQQMSMSMAETSVADCGRAGTWTYLRTDFAGTATADPICR